MFRVKYVLIGILYLFCLKPCFGQNTLPSNALFIGIFGQINSIHDNNGTHILAKPGSTYDSSNGLGISLGYTHHLSSMFCEIEFNNRVAKVVDNIALPNVSNKYKVVQDLYIGIGKTFYSNNKLFNNTSLIAGFNLLSIGQAYEGGVQYIPGYDINGNPTYKEYKPSTIQFPAISIGASKLLYSKCLMEVEYLMYNGEWRQDLYYFNYGSIFRFSVKWKILSF